jgi:hypothetical protein
MLLIDSWDNELDNMNNGKEGGGAFYRYSNSFVQLLDWLYESGYMRAYFHLPYRQTDRLKVLLESIYW